MRKRLVVAVFLGFSPFALGCGLVGFDSAPLGAVDGGDSGLTDGMTLDGPDGSRPPPTQLAHVCGYANATVILDGDAVDERVGAEMAGALSLGCGTSPTVRMLSQDTPGLLDPTTHAPMLGAGDLGIVGGDSYYQDVMVYLQMSASPVHTTDTGTTYTVVRRSTGAVLLDTSTSNISASHDYAVIQIIHDDASNSTVVATHGYYFGGTLAGSYYFVHNIAPTLSTETRGYFLVEWLNGDANAEPSAGDTYTLLATGP